MNGSIDFTTANKTTEIRQVSTFGLTTFLITAIFLLPAGIVGNVMVILVVRKKRYLRTKTNFLLANLATCDLVSNVLGYTWGIARAFPIPKITLGVIICKINSFYPAASGCSVLILTIIALERYGAIVKPLNSRRKLKKRTLRYFIIAIWIFTIAAVIPLVYFSDYNVSSTYECERTWSITAKTTFWTTAFTIFIVVPLLVMLFCYAHIIRALYFGARIVPMNIPAEVDAREKKRVIKMSIIVTVVFIVAFTPFVVVKELEMRIPLSNGVKVLSLLSVLLSSILNPFIYAFQSSNYRHAFKEIICVLQR
ncbi:somatostatin receptor type 5-like [Stylophora pistillata]|uniref:somatostatin receptor type 5-like n=1 Tax=Stylophora pistillata TaxID=50429 RepID=UPI000C03CAB1|nr:somatostatin receptor type 5-like [Stylophora pistillata]